MKYEHFKYEHFTYQEHGFAGHLAAPDSVCDKAVFVMMGGEKSLLPGIKIAERFAGYGVTGLAVSLFGAEGLPDSPDRIPLEMFESALHCLADRGYSYISTYGMSMGSIFAVLTAVYFGGVETPPRFARRQDGQPIPMRFAQGCPIENVILVSPTHVLFEGTDKSKKHMSGHSVATFRGEDIPFVSADFSDGKAARYQKTPEADYPVMGMWISYYKAYQDKVREQKALLPMEKSNARILLIAGDKDEAWPSAYSVRKMEAYLIGVKYEKEVKAVIYKNVSHLTGMMPNRKRENSFADGTFDLATAFETVYFWPALTESFAEVHRVLRDDGRFFICNESDGDNPADSKWEQMIQGMKIYKENEMVASLKQAEDIGAKNPMAHNVYMSFVFMAIWKEAALPARSVSNGRAICHRPSGGAFPLTEPLHRTICGA